MSKLIDLTGLRFGRLLVVGRSDKRRRTHVLWNCICDCGKKVEAVGLDLRDGSTKSCGCFTIDRIRELGINNKKEGSTGSFNALYASYKSGSRNRKIEFKLTKEEFKLLVTKNCSYCGEPPKREYKPNSCIVPFVYNGIDRIDSKVGYVKDNCTTCCWDCNRIKGSLSYAEFIKTITKIYMYYRKES